MALWFLVLFENILGLFPILKARQAESIGNEKLFPVGFSVRFTFQ